MSINQYVENYEHWDATNIESKECFRGRLMQVSGTCWLNAFLNILFFTPKTRYMLIDEWNSMTIEKQNEICIKETSDNVCKIEDSCITISQLKSNSTIIHHRIFQLVHNAIINYKNYGKIKDTKKAKSKKTKYRKQTSKDLMFNLAIHLNNQIFQQTQKPLHNPILTNVHSETQELTKNDLRTSNLMTIATLKVLLEIAFQKNSSQYTIIKIKESTSTKNRPYIQYILKEALSEIQLCKTNTAFIHNRMFLHDFYELSQQLHKQPIIRIQSIMLHLGAAESHAISGLTCNSKRYIYDSNLKKPIACDWLDRNATQSITDIYTELFLSNARRFCEEAISKNKFEYNSVFNIIIHTFKLDEEQHELAAFIRAGFQAKKPDIQETYTQMCIKTYLYITKHREFNDDIYDSDMFLENDISKEGTTLYDKLFKTLYDSQYKNRKSFSRKKMIVDTKRLENIENILESFAEMCSVIIFPRINWIKYILVIFMVTECVM